MADEARYLQNIKSILKIQAFLAFPSGFVSQNSRNGSVMSKNTDFW